MNTNEIIVELLKKNYPIESETVGPSNLQDITESEVDFVQADNGSYMDLGSAIGALVVATSFIKNIIDMYASLKKELGRKPENTEIKTAIKEDMFQKLDAKIREQLINEIIQKLDERAIEERYE